MIVKASLVKGDDGFPFFSISSNINIFEKLVLLKLIVLFLIETKEVIGYDEAGVFILMFLFQQIHNHYLRFVDMVENHNN